MESTSFNRKLVVILHADVAGYSRLVGQDEEWTMRMLDAYLDLIASMVADRHGHVVNFAGDAVLAEFPSVLDALHCAVDVQRELCKRNENLPDDRKLQFRIGINLGDVITDHGDIFGNDVNLAARLESLAEPGGICISATVYQQVRNKLPLTFQDIGHQRVKNISEPVHTYRVLLDPPASSPTPVKAIASRRWIGAGFTIVILMIVGVTAGVQFFFKPAATDLQAPVADNDNTPLPWWTTRDSAPALPAKPSIAVLPFTNLGGDAEQAYFSDGITYDIITDLSKFYDLFVIASHTMFTYRNRVVKVRDVGRELGVRYVLEGSVQRQGDKLRITARLTEAATEHQLWAERYERELQDLFALQNEMVETIVATLAVKVDLSERQRAMRKDTENLEAYDFVLRGKEYLSHFNRSNNNRARQMFEEAIELDPNYAAAYVGLAQTYFYAFRRGWTEFPDQALDKMQQLAHTALRLSKSSAAPHRLLATVYRKRNQLELSLSELEQAIALNPNDAENYASLGATLIYLGRADETIVNLETALRFNPNIDPGYIFDLAMAYYLKRRYDDAIQIAEKSLNHNPSATYLHIILAAVYAQADRPLDAARSAEMVRRRIPFFTIDSWGHALRDSNVRAQLVEGLRKAGLE